MASRYLTILILILKTMLVVDVAAQGFEGNESNIQTRDPDSQKETISVDCLLIPSIDARIASPVVGVIDTIDVSRGDRVLTGDTLFKLRSDVEEATLNLNRAKTEYGEKTIERNIDLYERNLISEQEKDEIVINNRIYRFEMEQTEAMLSQKIIKSPIEGIVVETFLDPGEYVGEEAVLQVVQLNPLYIEAVLPGRYFGKISSGDTVDVRLETPLNSLYRVKVDIVDSILDAASGTFGVRLILDNPEYEIPAGLKCSASFQLTDN